MSWFSSPPPPPPPPSPVVIGNGLESAITYTNDIANYPPPSRADYYRILTENISKARPDFPHDLIQRVIHAELRDADWFDPIHLDLSPDAWRVQRDPRYMALQSRHSYATELDRHISKHSAIFTTILDRLVQYIPPAQGASIFQTTLGAQIHDPRDFARFVFRVGFGDHFFIHNLKNAMIHNLHQQRVDMKGIPQYHPNDAKFADDEVLNLYFEKTGMMEVFNYPVPMPIPLKKRFTHTHILGPTGAGKSTLLQNLIMHDLTRTNASVVVIDPHHQLAPLFGKLRTQRRNVIIDARNSPGINIFDVPKSADDLEQEAVLASTSKLLTYLFRSEETSLTGKQNMVFRYLCQLVLSRENAGLMDLFEFLRDPTPFTADIKKLDPIAQDFFKDFIAKTKDYRDTAGELKYRLQTILSQPSLRRMFTAEKTDFNLIQEMNAGSLILIDADMQILGDMAPAFGKIFLALIMESARKRGTDARPVFVYVDEAHRFMDEQVETLLTDARKYNVGLTLAHQNLGQITSSTVKKAIQDVGTKFAGGVKADDARALADDMKTTADFLLQLEEHHFALSSGGPAVSVLPKFNPLEGYPRLSDAEYAELTKPKLRPATSPQPSPQRDEPDVASDW